MTTSPRVLVMGAINQDEIAHVRVHPKPGETVVTDTIEFSPGGKGANQAAAAASSGFAVQVQVLGAVGDDPAGEVQLRALETVGVDTSLIRRVIGMPTGRAHITVSADGENSIVVGLGANAFVSSVNINGAAPATVIVGQTEIGSSAIDALAKHAVKSGARFVLNNAPVVPLRMETLAVADPLILNEIEAVETLDALGIRGGLQQAAFASALKAATGCNSVIVTLGSEGCLIAHDDEVRHFPAVPVSHVVNTTGAGDCFVGTLAAALASGCDLVTATDHALKAAADAVAWHGARAPVSSLIT